MNIYADMSFALSYFQDRLHVGAWDCATPEDRRKALTMATVDIDRLDYAGCKLDATQSLEFPRTGQVEVPEDIKIAACEIALARLDGVDPDQELTAAGMTSSSVAGIRSTYDRSVVPDYIFSGIASASAWRFLVPYLRDKNAFKISRVS